MKGRLVVAAFVVALMVGLGGCSSGEKANESSGSTAPPAAVTLADAGQASTSTVSTDVAADDGMSTYSSAMKAWFVKYEAQFTSGAGALDGVENPLTATAEQLDAVNDFASLVDSAASELADLEPPSELSAAHAQYATSLSDMAKGLGQFVEAVKGQELSLATSAMATMEAAAEKGASARTILEKALGFSLSGGNEGVVTTESGAVGTRGNPVPVGQEIQVGPWKVKVVDVVPDSDDVVLNHNEFNERPQAGNQYVMIKIAATRTADEAAAFSMDMYCVFVGSGGNTFDVGYAAIPDPISQTGEAYKGASVTGNLVFEVPSNQVAGGTLRVEESFSLEDTETFFAVD